MFGRQIFSITILKIYNPRNLLFLGLYCLLFGFFIGMNYMDPIENITPILSISHKTYFIWILIILGNQRASGLWTMQLSNGFNRNLIFKEAFALISISTLIFYLLTLILFSGFAVFDSEYILQVKKFIGLPILAFLTSGIIALLLSIIFKNTTTAVVVAFFLYDIEGFAAKMVTKLMHPDLGVFFPLFNSGSLISPEVNPDASYALILFTSIPISAVLIKLSRSILMKMDLR